MKQLAIVDFETTGLDAETDEIIEVGITIYRSYDDVTFDFISTFSCLREPTVPISEEAFKVHGITEEMCKGAKIPVAYVESLIEGSTWLMAHNAPFDYQMAKHSDEVDFMCEYDWLDSLRHIDWAAHGHTTRNLNYVLADTGKVNIFPHRASPDTMTTMVAAGEYLEEAIENAGKDIVRIQAFRTNFAHKDIIKGAGMRWHPGDGSVDKHWWFEGDELQVKAVYDVVKETYSSEPVFKRNVIVTRTPWKKFLDEYVTV